MIEYLLFGLTIGILISLIVGLIIFIWYILTRRQQPKTSDYDRKINDLENILVILVSSLKDGKILYSKYFTSSLQLDTEYLHALISTINMMAENIGEKKAKLRRMEYDQKIIVIHHGKWVRGVILCKENPSNYLEDTLTIIAKRFENKFVEELQGTREESWKSYQIDDMIRDVYGKNMTEIKIVLWTDTEEQKDLLTSEEIMILNIATVLIKEQGEFFTLPQLVKKAHRKINKGMKETLKIVENLANRKYIVNYVQEEA